MIVISPCCFGVFFFLTYLVDVHLRDLTEIEEHHMDFVEGKLLNFHKCKLIFEVLSEIETCQHKLPNLDDVTEIDPLLESLPHQTERQLLRLSKQLEPEGPTSCALER